jgi:hypothetical protein
MTDFERLMRRPIRLDVADVPPTRRAVVFRVGYPVVVVGLVVLGVVSRVLGVLP